MILKKQLALLQLLVSKKYIRTLTSEVSASVESAPARTEVVGAVGGVVVLVGVVGLVAVLLLRALVLKITFTLFIYKKKSNSS